MKKLTSILLITIFTVIFIFTESIKEPTLSIKKQKNVEAKVIKDVNALRPNNTSLIERPFQEDISYSAIEKSYDNKLRELKKLTHEINQYAVNGGAPEELKTDYAKSREEMILLHSKYINLVNKKIMDLTNLGRSI